MSDELLKNEGEDEEVDAHGLRMGHKALRNDEGATSEDEEVDAHGLRMGHKALRNDEGDPSEDVEAHQLVRMANDDDDTDDVEAHRKRA